MNNNNIKIKNFIFSNFIVFFICLFLFFKPAFLSSNIFINELTNAICILISFISVIIYLISQRKKTNKLIISISIFFLFMFISTIINGEEILYFIKIYFPILGTILFFEMSIKNNTERFIYNIDRFFKIMIIINFISIFTSNTNNYERMYFLGYDNSFTPFITIGSLIIGYCSLWKYGKMKLSYWVLSFISIATCFMVFSANAKIMGFLLIIIDLIILLKINEKFSRIFNLKLFFILSIMFFIAIVVLRLQYKLSYIIVDVLNRDLTFTNRTVIWDRTLNYIKMRPLIGSGVEDFEIRTITKGIYHAHNNYLNILLEGGLLSLLAYFNIFRVVLEKIKNSKYINKIYILSFAGLCYFLITTLEYFKRDYIIYILLIIIYFSNEIWEERKK